MKDDGGRTHRVHSERDGPLSVDSNGSCSRAKANALVSPLSLLAQFSPHTRRGRAHSHELGQLGCPKAFGRSQNVRGFHEIRFPLTVVPGQDVESWPELDVDAG
jgi:hypothetical protein